MQKQNKEHRGRWISLSIMVIALVVVGSVFWWRRDHPAPKQIQTNSGVITANPNVPGGTNPNPATGSSASKDQEGNNPGAKPSPSVQPATPTGQFVSNHRPNLRGTPAPNTETSACTSTPGVKCKITFTSGSTVKSLPLQQTDGNGNTLWSNWTLQSIGLTTGSWQVAAVAINGPKTATAKDITPLVIAP